MFTVYTRGTSGQQILPFDEINPPIPMFLHTAPLDPGRIHAVYMLERINPPIPMFLHTAPLDPGRIHAVYMLERINPPIPMFLHTAPLDLGRIHAVYMLERINPPIPIRKQTNRCTANPDMLWCIAYTDNHLPDSLTYWSTLLVATYNDACLSHRMFKRMEN